MVVHTSETVRLRYFTDLLMACQRPVMLVGNAGCGKTVLINDKLSSLSKDETLVTMLPLNYYTTSLMLQQVGGIYCRIEFSLAQCCIFENSEFLILNDLIFVLSAALSAVYITEQFFANKFFLNHPKNHKKLRNYPILRHLHV